MTDVYVGDAWLREDAGFGACAVGASVTTPRPRTGGGDVEMGAAEADCTLFVGNLETKVTEELLFELFHQVGGRDRPSPSVVRWRRAGPRFFRASWAVGPSTLPVGRAPTGGPGTLPVGGRAWASCGVGGRPSLSEPSLVSRE